MVDAGADGLFEDMQSDSLADARWQQEEQMRCSTTDETRPVEAYRMDHPARDAQVDRRMIFRVPRSSTVCGYPLDEPPASSSAQGISPTA